MVYELCLVAIINKKDKEIFDIFLGCRETNAWVVHHFAYLSLVHGDFYMVLLQQYIGLSILINCVSLEHLKYSLAHLS